MKSPNHLLGGLVFTGLCSALSGVNIFATPVAVATTLAVALLPDIDHPKSLVGKIIPPLSYQLNRRYGHRTITHSAIALLGLSFLFASIEKIITGSSSLGLVFFYAYLSHMVLDMITQQGVPLLYPFFFETHHFVAIPLDSLNTLAHNQFIAHLEVTADRPFRISSSQEIHQKTVSSFQADWITHFAVSDPLSPAFAEAMAGHPIFAPNPRIPILRHQHQLLQQQLTQAQTNWQNHQQHLKAQAKQLEIELKTQEA